MYLRIHIFIHLFICLYITYTCVCIYLHTYKHTNMQPFSALQNTLFFSSLTWYLQGSVNLYGIEEEIKAKGSYIICSKNRPKTWISWPLKLERWLLSGLQGKWKEIRSQTPSSSLWSPGTSLWTMTKVWSYSRLFSPDSCLLLSPSHAGSSAHNESTGLPSWTGCTWCHLERKVTPGFGVQQGLVQITSINPSSPTLGKPLCLLKPPFPQL